MGKEIFEEVMAESFPKLMKTINLHITEPWKTPKKINSETDL